MEVVTDVYNRVHIKFYSTLIKGKNRFYPYGPEDNQSGAVTQLEIEINGKDYKKY